MNLANYSALKAALQDFLVGHQITDETAATFIALAEAEFRRIRVREMITRSTATLGETVEFISLPSDWLEAIAIKVNDNIIEVSTFDRANRLNVTQPYLYSISGDQLRITPPPTSAVTIEMTYYAAIPSLSDAEPTNYLTRNYPELLLYAALAHASQYIADPQRGMLWRAEAERIKAEMVNDTQKARFGGSPLIMRPRVRF